jgi:SAM-dependent methyltransferase
LALRYLCRWDQAGMTGDATDVAIDFNNGAAYDRFMGRWSRAVGALFLNWVVPPKHARRLEVGCGTGAFTELVLHTCSPSGIIATDSAVEQIETAKHQLGDERVEFQIANAQMLPFPGGYFDVIASALVLNFGPKRSVARNATGWKAWRHSRCVRLGLYCRQSSKLVFGARIAPHGNRSSAHSGLRRLNP